MAKAHADKLQHIFNKLGAALAQGLPHARVVIGTPAAEVADEVVELVVNATRSLRVHLSESIALTTLDKIVELHDAVQATLDMAKVGGRAHAGTPAAVSAGDNAMFAFDLTQSLRTYLSTALNYTLDSITTRNTPASGIDQGSVQVSNIAATPAAAVSTPCIEATFQSQVGNAPIGCGGGTIGGVANDGVLLVGGMAITLEVDDLQIVNFYGTILNQRIDITFTTRA